MKIYSIYDPEFKAYGQIAEGYELGELIEAMKAIDLPESGTAYEPGIESLEKCAVFEQLRDNEYGGLPIQLGMCWGHNTKLNCLEYHRDSEVNIGSHDFILMLAKQDEIVDGVLDTTKVKAFRAPAGVAIEVYATTLHYAPCHVNEADGFRVAVVLPRGTNTDKPAITPITAEDKLLWARNKWLIAHKDGGCGDGAFIGLVGENITI